MSPTGWTECLPLVTRDGSLVVEAMKQVKNLFPWLLRGVDFDNDSAFMNDVVVPWCREQARRGGRRRDYFSFPALWAWASVRLLRVSIARVRRPVSSK